MLLSFFESIKYTGHIYPIAFMRIYIGYHYISLAIERIEGQFLVQPRLAAMIMNNLPDKELPAWYAEGIQTLVVPNWQIFAYFLVYAQILLGASMLLGFLVRPMSLFGILMCLNAIFLGNPSTMLLNQLFLVMFISLFWVGAGRCLGFDYYFYKRQRGIWW